MSDVKSELMTLVELAEKMLNTTDIDELNALKKVSDEMLAKLQLSNTSPIEQPKAHVQSPKRLKLTKKMVKDALVKTRGNVALSAQSLGTSRQTVYSYMERYPDLKGIRDDAVEYITDIAEGHLETMVMKKDQRAIEFWLRTRGRGRGYMTSGQMTVSGDKDAPITIRVVRG